MLKSLFVDATAWVAVACWLSGAFARALRVTATQHDDAKCQVDRSRSLPSQAGLPAKLYRWSWLIGALVIGVHIVASYGLVHHWSHAAALEMTALESEAITGIRAPWGVYVNFAFAAIWFGYSLTMFRSRRRGPGIEWRVAFVDRLVFAFTLLIVFSATVIFESGPVRWASLIGFLLVMLATFFARGAPRRLAIGADDLRKQARTGDNEGEGVNEEETE